MSPGPAGLAASRAVLPMLYLSPDSTSKGIWRACCPASASGRPTAWQHVSRATVVRDLLEPAPGVPAAPPQQALELRHGNETEAGSD